MTLKRFPATFFQPTIKDNFILTFMDLCIIIQIL